MPLDWSDFTSARARIGLFATQKWNKTVTGHPGEIREFTARALTDAVTLSKSKLDQYIGAGTSGTGSASNARIGRHVLKAVITGDANGDPLPFIQNPHSFLVDPCNLDTAPDLVTSIALVKLFPTFITNQDFVMNDDAPIGKEDIIKVSLTVGPDGSLNLEQGEILALVSSAENRLDLFNACESLKGKFNRNTVELLEVTADFELPEEVLINIDASAAISTGALAELAAKDKKLTFENSISSPTILYLGDSQMAGALGNALKSVAGAGNRIAKVGVQPNWFLPAGQPKYGTGEPYLTSELAKAPAKIIIQLGDNGTTGYQDLINTIKASPAASATVIWSGATPVILPDPPRACDKWPNICEPEHAEKRNSRNESKNKTLKAAVEKAGWTFIDPFASYTTYKCGSGEKCDGIHAPSSAAKRYASNISSILKK